MIQKGQSDNARQLAIGRAIRRVRKANGLSQVDLGGAVGVSQNWISNIERGWPCSEDLLTRIVEFLKVRAGTVAASRADREAALLAVAADVTDATIIDAARQRETEREAAIADEVDDTLRVLGVGADGADLLEHYVAARRRVPPRLGQIVERDGAVTVLDPEDGVAIVGGAEYETRLRALRSDSMMVASAQLRDILRTLESLSPVLVVRQSVLTGIKALIHDATELRRHYLRDAPDTPDTEVTFLRLTEAWHDLVRATRFIARGAEDLWPAQLAMTGEEVNPNSLTPPWLPLPPVALSKLAAPRPAWTRDENPYEPERLVAELAATIDDESSGRVFEISLQRCLEIVGIDGSTSASGSTVLVQSPAGDTIAIEQCPATAYATYVRASASESHLRGELLKEFAAQLRQAVDDLHMAERHALARLHILFVPGDHQVSAALTADSQLLDYAWRRGIVIASPSVVIAQLRRYARPHARHGAQP